MKRIDTIEYEDYIDEITLIDKINEIINELNKLVDRVQDGDDDYGKEF